MISKRRKKEPYLSPSLVLNECRISSAVSTVLRRQKFAIGDVAGAEHFGCGDLRQAASAVGVWGLKSACGELRQPIGYVRIGGIFVTRTFVTQTLTLEGEGNSRFPSGIRDRKARAKQR